MSLGIPLTMSDLKKLDASWITQELAEQAGLFRVGSDEGARLMGRHDYCNYAGIIFPNIWPGEVTAREYCLRRDCPDIEQRADGSTREKAKYLVPPGRSNLLYFAPGTQPEHLADTGLPIVMTEGPKKTLAGSRLAAHNRESLRFLAVGLSGVYNWRGRVGRTTGPDGGREDVKGVIPDLGRLAWTGRVVMIIFDSDTASNADVQRARQALAIEMESRGAIVFFIDLPALPGQSKTGIDDFLALKGPDAALELLERKVRAQDAGELTRLARLSPFEYGRERKAAAKRLGVSVVTLDKEIALLRAQSTDKPSSGKGRPFELVDIEPALDPVDGVSLVQDLVRIIRRYVVVTDQAALAIALWVIRAHAHEVFDINPRLALLSPEKRCGKTTLLEILRHLLPRPLLVSNITPAAVFRVIESAHPTLLLDEMDSFTEAHEELRGILNSGHTRDAARVIRTVGDEHEPREFSTWCPMVMAAIGRLPETLEDRSIIVRMMRRMAQEKVEFLRRSGRKGDEARDALRDLARRVVRWVQDATELLRAAEPELPSALGLRAADNWFPLLAIASVIGETTAKEAREAALQLSGEATVDSDSTGTQLLADIRRLLGTRLKIGSKELCEELVALEEAPWAEWNRGKPLSQNQLTRLLKPYGVLSRDLRLPPDDRNVKGYTGEEFEDAFARYLPSSDKNNASSEGNGYSNRDNATSCACLGDPDLFQSATEETCSVSEKGTNPAPDEACSVVADSKAKFSDVEEIFEEDHVA